MMLLADNRQADEASVANTAILSIGGCCLRLVLSCWWPHSLQLAAAADRQLHIDALLLERPPILQHT